MGNWLINICVENSIVCVSRVCMYVYDLKAYLQKLLQKSCNLVMRYYYYY